MRQYAASALVFSGRPDPRWQVTEPQAQSLRALWEQSATTAAPEPHATPLGYRGVSIICEENEEFFAYGGRVRMKTGTIIEWRIDEEQRFERLLLSTSPAGILPPEILGP
jgi:hypothetical protein